MRRRVIPRSLQSRLILTYLILTLLGLGGLILWTGFRLQTAVIEQEEHDLELEALIIANALRDPVEKLQEGEMPAGRPLETLVHSYAESIGVRVTVVNPRLWLLLSSDPAVQPHLEHDHPEIVAARSGAEQHDIRWDEWSGEERLFVAAPILAEGNELLGVVQLSVPMAPLYAEIRRTWASLLLAGAVMLLVTALVSLKLAQQVAGPIRKLTAVTERIAAGDLDQQVTPAGPDEIQRLGRAFNRMAERVREMLARQQAFVANAAHELRSPLTGIRLRIEMLERHGRKNPELAQHYLRQVESEIEHLRRLVDHLLTLSRLDEGEQLPRTLLDLAPILYDLADEMGPLVQAAGLRLHVDVPPHLPAVEVNADSMRMVVRNLLDNAIKYTPAGGEITLRARVQAAPAETPSDDGQPRRRPDASSHLPHNGASSIVIQVSDTGPGIPQEHLPHIFERFYRVNKTRSRRQGGAGLGLSLVHSIVTGCGGRIEVESEVGAGTTFTIYLPTQDVIPEPQG